MPSSIDHIVIISADLGTAVDNARSAGFTVVPGGTHGSGSTHNALIGFADGAYLELIAPTGRGEGVDHRWFARLRRGGGLVDFCLLGSNLAEETAAIRARGIGYSQPFAMQRLKPDGTRIAWALATAPGPVGESGWPFMIEDTTPRDMRVPHTAEETRHANGVIGVAGITVLVRDAARSAGEYENILGTPAQAPGWPLPGPARGAIFSLGSASILLAEPATAEEMEHLSRHGQGPYQLTLRRQTGAIASGPGTGTLLDPQLFSGARIALA